MIEDDIYNLYKTIGNMDTNLTLTILGFEETLRELDKRIRKLEERYDKIEAIPQSKRTEP